MAESSNLPSTRSEEIDAGEKQRRNTSSATATTLNAPITNNSSISPRNDSRSPPFATPSSHAFTPWLHHRVQQLVQTTSATSGEQRRRQAQAFRRILLTTSTNQSQHSVQSPPNAVEQEFYDGSREPFASDKKEDDAIDGNDGKDNWDDHPTLSHGQVMTDAYIRCGSNGPVLAQLPALDWNTRLRKAYTLLMWIRPVWFPIESSPHSHPESPASASPQRILYRWANAADDSQAVGVCVTASPWKLVAVPSTSPLNTAPTVQSDTPHRASGTTYHFHTTLTAYSLPHIKPTAVVAAGPATYTSWVQVPLVLPSDAWHLVAFTHVYPYLKRPTWTVTVNGAVVGQGELQYPTLNPHAASSSSLGSSTWSYGSSSNSSSGARLMDHCTLFHNVTWGGADLIVAPFTSSNDSKNTPTKKTKSDDQKSASELQAQPTSRPVGMALDVAAVALYPDAVSAHVQAVAAEAGPALALQKAGRILPTLPPVPNWSKGSSLEGPKVGIPLTVHGVALELQGLSGRVVWAMSALHARVLGGRSRILCPFPPGAGSSEGAPRVGLVEATPPAPSRAAGGNEPDDEEGPVLYWTGDCTLHHALTDYLLQDPPKRTLPPSSDYPDEDDEDDLVTDLDLSQVTGHLSVALAEQQFTHAVVMPFFLACCPATKVLDMQIPMYQDSLRQLFDLYVHPPNSLKTHMKDNDQDPLYAAHLIELLALWIQAGGGRIQEEVLQSGTLHILASCLRQTLVRAARLKLWTDPPASRDDLIRRAPDDAPITQHHRSDPTNTITPSYIPPSIQRACVTLIDVCSGPASPRMEDLPPSMQVRRTSDLALTAVFGLALDWDLWSGDAAGCEAMFAAVAQRYGGLCRMGGYVMRSQLSVQHLLDEVRIRFDGRGTLSSPEWEHAAHHLSQILLSMLLSSCSNKRTISQNEHDVAACVAALSDCPLGSVAAHMILHALVALLVWCEVLPMEALPFHVDACSDEEQKMQVASRLGRNLLVVQFHDVVAPVILSRTVVASERAVSTKATTPLSPKQQSTTKPDRKNEQGSLSWHNHWRLSLLLFSWVSSIAGPEGVSASKSAGNLLLTAGLAGTLKGALEDSSKALLSALFLPPPGMALMIGSTLRNEWSYTDLLSDRLYIMMPLLPGIVASLLSNPTDQAKLHAELSFKSLSVLAEVLTAVGGALHRVFGGVIHSASGSRRHVKSKNDGSSEAIRGAKTYVPHLVVVAMLLENQASLAAGNGDGPEVVSLLRRYVPGVKGRADSDSWVDVSSPSTSSESVVNELVVAKPPNESGFDAESASLVLRSCQRSVVNAAAGLLVKAMNVGGAGSALALWKSVLSTLDETIQRSASIEGPALGNDQRAEHEQTVVEDERSLRAVALAKDILCRLCALVLSKALKREEQWEVWSYELSSAVSKVCLLVEEKGLLVLSTKNADETKSVLSEDQIVLFGVILDILCYGREITGWCQLALPTMTSDSRRTGVMEGSAASKVLLPILHPCLRLVLGCVGYIERDRRIIVAGESSDPQTEGLLLEHALTELDHTLTAAIVGLAFASARDAALNTMAMLRRTIGSKVLAGDEHGVLICISLFCKIAEELRVRYESERRLRETALFDAYEGGPKQGAREAIDASRVVERLILGGDVLGAEDFSEEITFDSGAQKKSRNPVGISDDFVLFHKPSNDPEVKSILPSRLGFAQYEGLGAALESFKKVNGNVSSQCFNIDIQPLAPFLDAWDDAAARDLSESELVEQFETRFRLSSAEPEGIHDTYSSSQSLPSTYSGAADAMSSFFEFATSEKMRLKDIALRFLPGHRYSRIAYSERFCWSRFLETTHAEVWQMWERAVPDGNRDIRSHLMTVPCAPQFRRYIPRYLDHGTSSKETVDEGSQPTVAPGHRASLAPAELDIFTKTLLEAGNLEIVDVTKKSLDEDEEPDLAFESPLDEEDVELFADSELGKEPAEASHQQGAACEASRSDMEGTEDTTHIESSTQEEASTAAAHDVSGKGHYSITTSSFATPPDNASSSLSLMSSAAAGMIEKHVDSCLHVRAEGSRPCSMLLTATHIILEYDADSEGLFEGELIAAQEESERERIMEEGSGSKDHSLDEAYNQTAVRRQREIAALRPKSIRWNLTEISHIYLRRYRLRDSSLEIFFIPSGGSSFGGFGMFSPSTSLFLDFGPGHEGSARRDDAAVAIMERAPPQAAKQFPGRSLQFLHEQLSRLTMGWVEGRVSNFDYLLHLNMLAGRSYNDICQYPVFPWVLSEYSSEEIPDLGDRNNFRDLSKPIGALNPKRLEEFIERFNTFADPSIPPFMYGSHYSTSAGVVLHFLVRLHPFAGLHRQLQSGHFDVADRLFSSVPRTWLMCTGRSAAEVKELTPEWYCNPAFLRNSNNFKLGTSQDGEVLGDVALPPWAKGSPEIFIEVMRAALESDICSSMLPDWIDLIFGRKQQGPESVKANNVFFYLTYYNAVDVANIKDPALRQATELQIAHFGQCPMQLFKRPHLHRLPRQLRRLSFFQLTSSFCQRSLVDNTALTNDHSSESASPTEVSQNRKIIGEPFFHPFYAAPLSHWVHLGAPPPGPHAPLVAVRFAGNDRCLAIDAKGVFHTFRWAWRADDPIDEQENESLYDAGCFVAQRELPRFRTLPSVMRISTSGSPVTVAISKTLFAGRSVLLVLSDGDGCGGLGMQLVDPAKGTVKGEAIVPQVHSAVITCIATDPIGTAAGHAGVGGELALVGSADGNASLWRFMSSNFLPLRPRIKLNGHSGEKIIAVALCSTMHIAATLSAEKCCLYSIGNGSIIRVISPPLKTLDMPETADLESVTRFADTPALAVSSQGFIVAVCETTIRFESGSDRTVATLHLLTIEGISLGSKPLESWRGLPHKLICTPDGTAVLVCCGRGVTIHRISACQPLEFIDEWQITESDDLSAAAATPSAWDIDLGPSATRPVVAAAGCSNGALRLHALPGISAWSERHKKSGITLGSALAKPARRLNQVVRDSFGLGRQLVGMGREIGQEVTTDVKERGVGGFFGSMMRKTIGKK